MDPVRHAAALSISDVEMWAVDSGVWDVERVRGGRCCFCDCCGGSVCVAVGVREAVQEVIVVHFFWLLLRLLLPLATTRSGACSTNALALARLLALRSPSTRQPATGHTLVPRHNVDQKIKQIRPSNRTRNIRPLDRPPLVLLGNQKRTTRKVRDENLAHPRKQDGRLGRDHLDLVVGLHDLFDARQRQLTLRGQAGFEVDNVAVGIAALLDEVHLVAPEGGLEVVEVLRGVDEGAGGWQGTRGATG